MSNYWLAIAVIVASTTAQADKYTRQQNVKIAVNISDRAKPIIAKPKPAAGPTLGADGVLALAIAAMPLRSEQEAILIKLIDATPDSAADEKADLYFRLGELYAKQHQVARLKGAGDEAKRYLLAAVKAYQALTDNDAFRNYARLDTALFYYGYMLKSGKYMKEARAVFDKLLKNYPNSRYVAEAHFVFGEYFFEQGQLADAEARYKQVLKFPKSSVYWYAMYKIGWVELNLARHTEALETFFQIAQATKTDGRYEMLRRAAEKDFVRAYAEIGKADKAFDAFKRVDQKAAFTMLASLGDLYVEQGKSDKGIYTFHELMRLAPANQSVCLWQYNVAHLTLSLAGATLNDKVTEIENLARLWSALSAKHALPAGDAQDCRDNAAAMSGELAHAYHSEAVRTQNLETLGYAERLYKAYLDAFPTAADFAQTRYWYAELLWSRAEAERDAHAQPERWGRAAGAFTDAIKTGKLDAKLTKESAYAAVLASIRALEDERAIEPVDDPPAPPKPLPSREQKLMAAFDFYIKITSDPKDDMLVEVKFRKARVLRRFNHFAEANRLFEEILAQHAEHETAEFAANLLLDTYNRRNDEASLIALADRLLATPKLLAGRDDLAKRVKQLKRTYERKQADQLAKAKDYSLLVRCGNAYLEIYNRTIDAKDNDEVLYNAGVCYEQGRSLTAAAEVYNSLERYYPDSKLTARAIARRGRVYADMALYEKAAEQLERYAKKYAGEKDSSAALSDAVVYRKGNGEDAKAIEDTKYFVKTFAATKPGEAANAAFSLTSIYEKLGDQAAVIRHLREYIAVHGAKGGRDKLVIAHAKIGRILFDESCPVKPIDGACIKIARSRAIATRHLLRVRGSELPTQCGAESKIKLTVVQRDQRKVHDAMMEFAAAAREYAALHGESGEARHYFAAGKLAEADVELEKYLEAKFPDNLDFDPRQQPVARKSLARFDGWVGLKTKLGATARAKYEAVLAVKDAASSIAAAARLGQIPQHFSDALFTAEIPQNLRSGEFAEDKVQAYCDKMTEVAEPLEARSVEAYGTCLAKSTELGWFSEWSRLCERELGQIKPEAYPTASELRGEASLVAHLVATEPPVKAD